MQNIARTQLGFDAFNGKVNINLFNEIVHFTAGTTTDAQRYKSLGHLTSTHLWYTTPKGGGIQEKYGFRYFGELLERYEERFGSDIADIRAITLALAYSKSMHTDEMFVGSQKKDFLRRVTTLSESDIYLKGALFLLNQDTAESQHVSQLPSGLLLHNQTEELIFVISLFDDFEQAFNAFKPQLIELIGKKRSTGVSGNTGIFCWLIKQLRKGSWLKGMRSKDIALFRALAELPVSFVKEGTRHCETLLNNGFSAEDIIYLNSVAVKQRLTPDAMDKNSITAVNNPPLTEAGAS